MSPGNERAIGWGSAANGENAGRERATCPEAIFESNMEDGWCAMPARCRGDKNAHGARVEHSTCEYHEDGGGWRSRVCAGQLAAFECPMIDVDTGALRGAVGQDPRTQALAAPDVEHTGAGDDLSDRYVAPKVLIDHLHVTRPRNAAGSPIHSVTPESARAPLRSQRSVPRGRSSPRHAVRKPCHPPGGCRSRLGVRSGRCPQWRSGRVRRLPGPRLTDDPVARPCRRRN